MWYKIEDIEDKYNISKFSIYALITQEPELRQYIKALEGVLQINDEGIELLLKHVEKDENNNKPIDNKEVVANKNIVTEEPFAAMDKKRENLLEKVVASEKEESTIPEAVVEAEPVVEAKKEEDVKEVPAVSLEEEFFTHTSLDREEDFFGETVDEDAPLSPIEAIVEEGVPEVDVAKEMSMLEDAEGINMPAYIKALKEKMIIQNKQVRAINEFLEVSKKLLLQDEKIIHILEKTDL
ncbi:hypothetical protein AZF37_07660 [endosymbiont 'TC1' of Trimyema compressum]|uniref:hypothetical protein n=1 Tax=endosymbiont 'TC1' of Trimyema compressum TaxID=243899 RepID=UPI0007F0E74F|nr:hypothetical protein [endosymbiont 'TC1' of Trimyema compressum]AMP21055.1 hypothetical protein AZF37_07660 [endosymbiont 'TC1' of Trimyema compressum]